MTMILPHGYREVRAAYGDIEIGKVNGVWQVISPRNWESANCKIITGLAGLGSKRLYVHNKTEEPLRRALARAERDAPGYAIRSIACFNPRMKRTTMTELSMHSWAIAVDINPDTNPLQVRKPGEALVCDMPLAFIDAFRMEGWMWGGDFTGPHKDPQHYQLAKGC